MDDSSNSSTIYISLADIHSPILILIWFEILTASLTYGFGFIGNLLSLIIFATQDEFRNVSTGTLFLLMTISNTIHLWTLTTEFLGVFNLYVYLNVFLQCRLNYFVQNLSRAVSTYLAVSATLDRWIRSEYPMRSRVICTRQNALKLCAIFVFIFCILFSFWFCPENTINPLTGTCFSGTTATYIYFFNYIFVPLRFVFVCIIPAALMSGANIRILLNIRRSRRRVEQGHTTDTNVPGTNSLIAVRRMTSLDRMMFYMMLVNVVTFTITQVPFHINAVIQAVNSTVDLFTSLLIRAMLLIWSSFYFGVGLYSYCFASPLFRKKFFLLCSRLKNCVVRNRPV